MRLSARINRHALTLTVASIAINHASAAPPTFSEQGASVLGGINVNGRSASFADIDNDGDLDLFFQGGGTAQQLMVNQLIETGSATYVNSTGLLPAGLGPSWSAAWGDYDGDGDVDVFVGQSNIGASGDLLRNDMPTGFTNMSSSAGLIDDPGFHQNVAWCDIDNDLDLDLIIAMEGPERHEIYIQNANGTFTASGAAANFQEDFGTKAYGMAIGDTDNDGDNDIYISTCKADNNIVNNFYENLIANGGGLTFVDIANSNGTQNTLNSYGAEFHDFDDDGDLDLFMVGADAQPTKIWRNDGGNQFTDVDTITGQPLLSDVAGDLNGGRAVDYDNDGDLDLFFHDHKVNAGADEARKLYRNDGNWQFTDVTALEGLQATNEGGYDSAWGDFDNDGDMDLCASTDSGDPERFYVSNASTNGNHWLQARLVGTQDNTTAIGAKLFATIHLGTASQRTLRRDANANAGTFNQSDLPVHIGLGAATVIDKLRIEWPNGQSQQLCDVAVDQYVTFHLSAFGDFDADGVVAESDLEAFVDCFSGPLGTVSPSSAACVDACMATFDVNTDSVIDLADFAAIQQAAGV